MKQYLDLILALQESIDINYRATSIKLLPNVDNMLGVRLPILHKLSKCFFDEDYAILLEKMQDTSMEETLVKGFMIAQITDFEAQLGYLKVYLNSITNWSICDSFCSALKISPTNYEKMWLFVLECAKDEREYYLRFSIVMMIFRYTNDIYIHEVLTNILNIKSDFYYVKMAQAWALSQCYVKYRNETLKFLNSEMLENFVLRKTFAKIIESNCISVEEKKKIRKMRNEYELSKLR